MSTIYAVGDMHGSYQAYVSLLVTAGLCDASLQWTGGNATLVQTGDLIDRGRGSLANLSLTKRLQEQAEGHGGQVVFLLGGHEIFALAAADGNDWAFLNWFGAQNGGHATMLEWLASSGAGVPGDDTELGALYAAFFGQFSTGEIGHWLRRCSTAETVGDSLFVHAGISSEVPGRAATLNQEAGQSIANLRTYLMTPDPVLGRRGPYWVRDLAHHEVRRSLTANNARRLVVGHNPAPSVTSKFDGEMVVIDTNVVRGGLPQCLVLDGPEALVLDLEGKYWPIEKPPGRPVLSSRHNAAVSAVGRFGQGDVVLFYHSPITGGRALLGINEVWSTGSEVFYTGSVMAYLPDRRNGSVRHNCNETWTLSGAFVDAVGVPLNHVIHLMPLELAKASAVLTWRPN